MTHDMAGTAPTGSERIAAVLAVAAGIGAWEVVRFFGVHREGWDEPDYWRVAYPLLVLAAFALGLVWRRRPWRWAALMMGAQAAWSFILALAAGRMSLFPLTLALFVILSLPCLLAAYVGSWVRRWIFGLRNGHA
jgi:hypothetical protein